MPRKKTPVSPPTEADVPKDLDAERALLGAILTSGRSAYLRAAAIVRPEDFFDQRHAAIFAAMGRVAASGAEIDPVTVAAEFSDGKRAN